MKSLKQTHVIAPLIIVLCFLIFPISLNAEKTKERNADEPSSGNALDSFDEETRKEFENIFRDIKRTNVGFQQQQRLKQQAQQQEEGEERGLLRSAGDPQMNGSQNITVGASRTGMHFSDILQVLLLVAMAVFLICATAKGRSQKNKSRENTSNSSNQVNIYQSVFFF